MGPRNGPEKVRPSWISSRPQDVDTFLHGDLHNASGRVQKSALPEDHRQSSLRPPHDLFGPVTTHAAALRVRFVGQCDDESGYGKHGGVWQRQLTVAVCDLSETATGRCG